MFTQCSKCETVFRLSAQALRAAGGQVRCGRCGNVFNALARLAEDSEEFTRGESPLEQESRAEQILQSTAAIAPADASPAEAAHEPSADISAPPPSPMVEPPQALPDRLTDNPAEIPADEAPVEPSADSPGGRPLERVGETADELEEEPVSDAMLEFTLPPTELDRIFIETTPSVLQLLASEANRPGRIPMIHAERLSAISVDLPEPAASEIQPMVPTHAENQAARTLSAPEAPYREGSPRKTPFAEPSPRDRAAPDPHAAASPGHSAAGAALRARRTRNTEPVGPQMPEIGVLRRRLYYPAWVSAAIVFTLLLGAQAIITNTNWFSAHPSLASPVAATRAKLSTYQLQQWGVTGDPDAKGTLHVHATIVNTSAQPVAYPLLRVTLADRFGTRIGRREFEASEYLGKPPSGMLAGGDRVDAALDVQDPGQEAEAFEIDMCLRGADKTLTCAGETADAGAAPQRK